MRTRKGLGKQFQAKKYDATLGEKFEKNLRENNSVQFICKKLDRKKSTGFPAKFFKVLSKILME